MNLKEFADNLSARQTDTIFSDKKVFAQICLLDYIFVENRKLGDSGQNETLQNFRSQSSRIQQTHVRPFQLRLNSTLVF